MTATDTRAPPTPTPSPTPLPPQITADNVTRLAVLTRFGEGEALRSLAFSPDGAVLASAGGNTEDFAIRLWQIPGGHPLGTLEGHRSIVWTVAFSPDGDLLASVSNDRTGKVWDWRTGSVLESLDFPAEIVSAAFSPDGETLAVGGVDTWPEAAVWTFSVPSWQPARKLPEFWNIPSLAFSPNGESLVGGGTSRNVRIWETDDGRVRHTLHHSGQVSSLAISPDGTTVASGLCEASDGSAICVRGAVWLWDLDTGRLRRRLSDFADRVTTVAYSIDGSLLIAGSRDGTIRFYHTADHRPVFTETSSGGSGVLAVSPDGRTLASVDGNGQVNLWQIAP